jgi:hypothetical protein
MNILYTWSHSCIISIVLRCPVCSVSYPRSLGSSSVTLLERISRKFHMIPIYRKVVIIFVKITFIHLPDVGIVGTIEPFANDICHMTRCTCDLKYSAVFFTRFAKFVPVVTRSTIPNNKL